jgi:HYR domain
MSKRTVTVVGSVVAASAVLVALAPSISADTASLHAALTFRGVGAACPSGYPSSAECHSRTAGPVAVSGLGFVSQSYVAAVDLVPVGCPAGTQKILSYPSRLIVKDRGQIFIAVAASSTCADVGVPLLSVAQSFTITGGTGAFAGASGSGVVSRTHVGCCPGFGTDNWNGTITAPGFVVDLRPPTIRGAHNRVVHAAAPAKRIPVKYRVSALDAVDGALRPTCRTRSGSRFRVGRRTTVRCSVSDRSANLSRAEFRVTVRRG